MPKETKVTQKCRETLKSVFGHEDYREGQEAIIEALLEGRDVLALLPTGAGKSLFFYVMNIYDNRVQNFGYACALSFILFALIGGLTAVVMKTSKWVYYTEEG